MELAHGKRATCAYYTLPVKWDTGLSLCKALARRLESRVSKSDHYFFKPVQPTGHGVISRKITENGGVVANKVSVVFGSAGNSNSHPSTHRPRL